MKGLFHSYLMRIFVRIFVRFFIKIFMRIFMSLLNRGPNCYKQQSVMAKTPEESC